jgi:hypothetical protein
MANQSTSSTGDRRAFMVDRAGAGHVRPHPGAEGVRAGCAGGTAVWLWLAASDAITRRPFSTPALIGRGLVSTDVIGDSLVPAAAHTLAVVGVAAFMTARLGAVEGLKDGADGEFGPGRRRRRALLSDAVTQATPASRVGGNLSPYVGSAALGSAAG